MNTKLEKSNLSNLPPEIIFKILRYLSFSEIETSRNISKSFDDVGKYSLCLSLRKMRIKLYSAMKCNRLFSDQGKKRKTSLKASRLKLGVCSVLHLSRLLATYDALLFPLMMSGMLPPLPANLLDDISKAVAIGTRRNPLIGRVRIDKLDAAFGHFYCTSLTSGYQVRTLAIDSYTALQIILDLLNLLPYCAREERQTAFGLQIKWNTPISYPFSEGVCKMSRLENMKFSTYSKVNLEALHQLAMYVNRTLAKYSAVDPTSRFLIRQVELNAVGEERRLELDEVLTARVLFLDIVSVPLIQSFDQLDVRDLKNFCVKISLQTVQQI